MFHYFTRTSQPGYLQGVDINGNPIYTEDYDEALWSRHENVIDLIQSNNSLTDVTKTAADGGGVTPPKRPGY